MGETVLVAVAHTDDEALGMGATIRRHVESGDSVHVVSMTNGVGARENSSEELANARNGAALRASEILGFSWAANLDFRDNGMDSYPLIEVVKELELVKKTVEPTLLYTHSFADLNIDHQVVSRAVHTAFRPQPGEFCREIRHMEIPSATDYGSPSITGTFRPNLFVDIADHLAAKLEALEAYSMEMRSAPHSRSLDGLANLARYRGNQVGLCSAEAFEVIRKLER